MTHTYSFKDLEFTLTDEEDEKLHEMCAEVQATPLNLRPTVVKDLVKEIKQNDGGDDTQ